MRRCTLLPPGWLLGLLVFGVSCTDTARQITAVTPPDGPSANILGTSVLVIDDGSTLQRQAMAINDGGVVTGYASIPGVNNSARPFRWSQQDGMQLFATLGGPYALALGINASGDIVGYSALATGTQRAFIWTAQGGMTALPTPRADFTSIATDVNDVGMVAGTSTFPVGNSSGFRTHAARWRPDRSIQSLGALQGSGTSFGNAINSAGAVVGRSDAGGGQVHPFLWTESGGMQDLGTLPGFSNCEALDINDSNHVVGVCSAASVARAFRWTPATGMQDLGTLGGAISRALAINDLGQIMGMSTTATGGAALFFWTESDGMENVTAAGGGGIWIEDLNNLGQYVGGQHLGEVDFEPNVAPIAVEGSATTLSGVPVAITLIGTDIHPEPLTFTVVDQPGHGTLTGNPPTVTYTSAAGFEGTDSFTFVVTDPKGAASGVATVIITVLPNNHPPVASTGGPYVGDEGTAIPLTLGGTDPDGDVLTFTWDLGDGTTGSGATPPTQHAYADNGSYTISLTADDGRGETDTQTTTATVANVAPTLGAITAPTTPLSVGTSVTVQASFTDPGVMDTHVASIQWGDGSTTAGSIGSTGGVPTASATHTYLAAGVYTVGMTVTDKDGGVSNTSTFEYIVVFDPSAGFVTGGGWIMSPTGACQQLALCGSTVAGKATFGFVSRYQKGATVPTGNTQFQYHAGNFTFRSTVYEWLVISGAMAQYKARGRSTARATTASCSRRPTASCAATGPTASG